jgi:hypothetical protein
MSGAVVQASFEQAAPAVGSMALMLAQKRLRTTLLRECLDQLREAARLLEPLVEGSSESSS